MEQIVSEFVRNLFTWSKIFTDDINDSFFTLTHVVIMAATRVNC